VSIFFRSAMYGLLYGNTGAEHRSPGPVRGPGRPLGGTLTRPHVTRAPDDWRPHADPPSEVDAMEADEEEDYGPPLAVAAAEPDDGMLEWKRMQIEELRRLRADNDLLKEELALQRFQRRGSGAESAPSALTDPSEPPGRAADLERRLRQTEAERDAVRAERDQLEATLWQSQHDYAALLQTLGAAGTPLRPTATPAHPLPPAHSTAAAPAPRGHNLFASPIRGEPLAAPAPEPAPPLLEHKPPPPSPPKYFVDTVSKPHPPPAAPRAPKPEWEGLEIFGVLGLTIEIQEGGFNVDEDGILHIAAVKPWSMAEKSGLRHEDRITKWNNHFISNQRELLEAIEKTAPKSRLRLHFTRRGIKKQALLDVP